MKPVQKSVSFGGNSRAHARSKRIEKSRKKGIAKGFLFSFLLPLLIIFALFVFFTLSKESWNGHDKFSLVFRGQNDEVGITVLDPTTPEMTTMYIPGDTQVDIAASYGTLRIKNVWQLGINEKKGGSLLSKTIAKNFLFPVHLWADTDGINLSKASFSGLAKFVFLPSKTNITFGDRLAASLFVLKLKNIEKNEIDLAKSQFLRKDTLNDGEKGYILSGSVSERLTVFFTDNDFADKNLRVALVDGSESYGSAQKVGEIIEVFGGKVVSVDKNQPTFDGVCIVKGEDVSLLHKVADVFGCTVKKTKTSFDLEIDLGNKFSKNF